MKILSKTKNKNHNFNRSSSSAAIKSFNLMRKKENPEISRLNLPISEIILPHPSPRIFTPGETVALAASIERVGQLCPICVREKGGKYHLLDGERRMRALMLLNAPTVDACIIKTSLNREQYFLAVHSGAALHPLEKARIIERVYKSGIDPSALNLSEADQLNTLKSLPDRIQRLLMEIPPSNLPPIRLLCSLAALSEDDCARALRLIMNKLNDPDLPSQLLKSDNDSSGIFQSLRSTQLYADNRLYLNSLLDILRALERNGCAVELTKEGPEQYKIHIRPAESGEQLHMGLQAHAI